MPNASLSRSSVPTLGLTAPCSTLTNMRRLTPATPASWSRAQQCWVEVDLPSRRQRLHIDMTTFRMPNPNRTPAALANQANEIRVRRRTMGDNVEAIAHAITLELPELLPLEAWRLAHGWTRTEVSNRLDALYEHDKLHPPHISGAQLCKWEADVNHLQQAGLANMFPRTNEDSQEDLLGRLQSAHERINMFGLTRNFYVSDLALPLFERKAVEIPVHFYVMHPYCDSRADRYRLEPAEAAMEDPVRYTREFLRPLHDAKERIARVADKGAGLHVWTYNFPCAFAVEEIDDTCRIMFYGAGKRGTEGPVMVFDQGTPYHDYFSDQIRFLERLATNLRDRGRARAYASSQSPSTCSSPTPYADPTVRTSANGWTYPASSHPFRLPVDSVLV